jgi:hypothetical protein
VNANGCPPAAQEVEKEVVMCRWNKTRSAAVARVPLLVLTVAAVGCAPRPAARKVEPIGHAIRDRVAGWAEAHAKTVDNMDVTMPVGITDRPADVWRSPRPGSEWRSLRSCAPRRQLASGSVSDHGPSSSTRFSDLSG